MCQKCEELLRQKNAAGFAKNLTGAATTASPATPTGTVDREIARMAQFLDVAAVTIMPNMFLGAPKGDAQKYAIGYVDTFGVKRAFVIDIDAAEEMAQGMLQEIAHVKAKNDRDTLKSDLRGIIGKIELGINLDAIRDELSDLAAEG